MLTLTRSCEASTKPVILFTCQRPCGKHQLVLNGTRPDHFFMLHVGRSPVEPQVHGLHVLLLAYYPVMQCGECICRQFQCGQYWHANSQFMGRVTSLVATEIEQRREASWNNFHAWPTLCYMQEIPAH